MTDLLCKSMNWFLYDKVLCHLRVSYFVTVTETFSVIFFGQTELSFRNYNTYAAASLPPNRNLWCLPLVEFKKREKHPWRSVIFSKVAGFSPMGVFHVFKIVQMQMMPNIMVPVANTIKTSEQSSCMFCFFSWLHKGMYQYWEKIA